MTCATFLVRSCMEDTLLMTGTAGSVEPTSQSTWNLSWWVYVVCYGDTSLAIICQESVTVYCHNSIYCFFSVIYRLPQILSYCMAWGGCLGAMLMLCIVWTPPLQLDHDLIYAPGFPSPPNLDYLGYRTYIDESLPPESPYLYGLHPNAEIGFLTATSESMFRTVLEMQPRDSSAGAGTGTTREEKVPKVQLVSKCIGRKCLSCSTSNFGSSAYTKS